MLEIWLAFTLCKSIKNNALARGRKPGGFIALAIVLWVVLEITGFIIGAYFELGYGTFIIAYGLVGIGAAISYNVAKHCKKGDYVTPQEQLIRQFTEYYEPLAVTQEILITREKAFAGSAAKYEMILNGKSIGFVANGDTLHGFTDQRQNVLVARVNGGNDIPPFVFQVADGMGTDIHFGAGRFIPEHSSGIVAYGQAVVINPALAVPRYVPVMETQPVAPVYGTPVQPVYANPGQPAVPVYSNQTAAPIQTSQVQSAPVQTGARFCESCGSQLSAGSKFCGKCGARVE